MKAAGAPAARWAEAGCPALPRHAVPGLQQRRSRCGPGAPCSHGTEPRHHASTAAGHRWHQGHAPPLPASDVSVQNMFSRQEEKQLDRNAFLILFALRDLTSLYFQFLQAIMHLQLPQATSPFWFW